MLVGVCYLCHLLKIFFSDTIDPEKELLRSSGNEHALNTARERLKQLQAKEEALKAIKAKMSTPSTTTKKPTTTTKKPTTQASKETATKRIDNDIDERVEEVTKELSAILQREEEKRSKKLINGMTEKQYRIWQKNQQQKEHIEALRRNVTSIEGKPPVKFPILDLESRLSYLEMT